METKQNLWIKETGVNATEGYLFFEPICTETSFSDVGELFKALKKEYGKATNMYIDGKGGKSKKVGWVFQKTAKYEDSGEPYKQETWIEVYETEPIQNVKIEGKRHIFN
jgi:hypothetical protein